jgi:hypothetical protein
MSYGFLSPLYNHETVQSWKGYLETRWKEGEYVPLATEASGVYAIFMGSYSVCKACTRNGREGFSAVGFTPRTSVAGDVLLLVDGIFRVTYLPRTAATYTCDLASKFVKAVDARCRKEPDPRDYDSFV